ncbi:DUF6776 family protein [Pseudomarimonas arenosa]|nr:DUF6776 family protein [Pseudomarimonas arenosa]
MAAWLLTLLAAAAAAYVWSAGRFGSVATDVERLEQELAVLRGENGELKQQVSVLGRSDQVSREALNELQADLAARDEEIAGLRADVVFYERLVGGSAQRKGLSIHSVRFEPGAASDHHFQVTLTQNLKKSGVTKGSLSVAVEGVQSGKLTRLDWAALRQQPGAAGLPFEFRYFQQVEGSVMFPEGFTPHRVHVTVERDGADVRETLSWEDTTKTKGG